MPRSEAVLGFRAHSGWAVVVAMAGETPVLRRRIGMGAPQHAQPYHAAESMKVAAAQAFLDRRRAAAIDLACAEIRAVVGELESAGYLVKRSAVLTGSGKPLPELAKVLAAHPLLHTAEGIFFREVVRDACQSCRLAVREIPEKEVQASVLARTALMSKVLGPPWRLDEKLAASAAIYAG